MTSRLTPSLSATLVAALCLFLAACSSTEPTAPAEVKPTVRLYNGMVPSKQARLTISATPYEPTVSSGYQGPRQELSSSMDNVEVVVDNGSSSVVHSRVKGAFPASSNSSVVMFPSTTVFEPTRLPDTAVIVRDSGTVPSGKCRLRVINATDAFGELSVFLGDDRVVTQAELPFRSISGWVTVDPGSHLLRVVRQWQIPYDAAVKEVVLSAGTSYTLFLTGTLQLADSWPFTPRLLSESAQEAPVDLLIPPDVGNFQIVNAVIGVRNFDVKIDGKASPKMVQVAFPNATGYQELDLGTHTVEVLANGTPLVTNVRTLATLRSRKTMFVTGTLVPPNIVGMELEEPERAQDPTMTSLRVVNLSPDAPLLDIVLQRDTTELLPDGFRSLEFRESSAVAGTSNQFITIAPGRYRVVAYRAGSKNVVLPPTDVTFEAAQVRTLWVGGLLSSIGLYSVNHSK
ncbi:MAG: DUF4397 domain-containing protein [Candidatus Kapaibacterium sp.]